MTHTQIINENQIRSIINEVWNDDDYFFSNLAVNETKELSIKDTSDKVVSFLNGEYDAAFYSIKNDNNTIGYIVVAPKINVLFSFGIKVNFRNKENKRDFISLIDSFFTNGQIVLSLYKKNQRAIDFFIKNGYEKIKDESVTLIKTL